MSAVYLDPGGTGVTISELWAWLAGPVEDEGVVAVTHGELVIPLVGADRERIESYRGEVEQLRRNTGAQIRLVRWGVREVLEEL